MNGRVGIFLTDFTDTTFGKSVHVPMPDDCNVMVLCVNEGRGLPAVRVLLPHQLYREEIARMATANLNLKTITCIPARCENYCDVWERLPSGDAAAATAAAKADAELVRCQCGSLAVIETPAYGGARYKCDECGADWISSAAATAAANNKLERD